jgi:hypothetical protein
VLKGVVPELRPNDQDDSMVHEGGKGQRKKGQGLLSGEPNIGLRKVSARDIFALLLVIFFFSLLIWNVSKKGQSCCQKRPCGEISNPYFWNSLNKLSGLGVEKSL